MTGPFKTYKLLSKADQPGYVYLGEDQIDENEERINDCIDHHLFSSLIGSKNVFITPISSEGVLVSAVCGRVTKVCSIYEYFVEGTYQIQGDIIVSDQIDSYHRFISLDTRWYNFRDVNTNLSDYTRYSPNCFVSSFTTRSGDLIVDWRSLTSDGSVLIKTKSTSNAFWNGTDYISDADAFYDNNETLDYIYLKTLQNVDIVRNSYETASTIIYKKYADENISQSSFITKKIRGSHCIEIENNAHDIKIKDKEICTYPTDVIMDNNVFDNQFILLETMEGDLGTIETYRQTITLPSSGDMNWLEQFEYNVFNQLFNSSYPTPTFITDLKNVDITFSEISRRQNLFYGIDPQGIRQHHKLSTAFSFESEQSLSNPTFLEGLTNYPRLITRLTEEITDGRVSDGLMRVIVPPGVVFRTLKALPGFHSLYEKQYGNTRPDELHFAVDVYGNILGERSLPSPGLSKFVDSTEPSKSSDYDIITQSQVEIALEELWKKYYEDGQVNFDSDLVNDFQTIKNDNQMSYTSPHVYMNIHNIPIWIEVDIFYDYIIDYDKLLELYENRFKPVAFYDPSSNLDYNSSIDHSKEVKDDTYWNEIIKRYELGTVVNSFEDDQTHWKYDGKFLENI